MGRLIVVGASAGGVRALQQLVAGLARGLQAHVLIVLHIGEHPSVLPQLLAAKGVLPVSHARSGEPIEMGRITVAPPDHHMLVEGDRIVLTRGPKEHSARPSIDPLFRSAALSHGERVIGVVLTGRLDDGTPGLLAIKRHGGIAIVQDPDDAEEKSMPRSALHHVEVDHCVALSAMPALLASLVAAPTSAAAPRPPASPSPFPSSNHDDPFVHEQNLALGRGNAMEELSAIATPTTFACPDCHGTLWKIAASGPERYRCHTGHAFTLRTMQHAMAQASDEAGWNALRAFQEHAVVLAHMTAAAGSDRDNPAASRLAQALSRLERQTAAMRALLEERPEPIE